MEMKKDTQVRKRKSTSGHETAKVAKLENWSSLNFEVHLDFQHVKEKKTASQTALF